MHRSVSLERQADLSPDPMRPSATSLPAAHLLQKRQALADNTVNHLGFICWEASLNFFEINDHH